MCRHRDNEKRKIRLGTSNRREHVEKGLCFFCDNPVKEDYKVCEKHYWMNIENAAKGRETGAAKEYIKLMKKNSDRKEKI